MNSSTEQDTAGASIPAQARVVVIGGGVMGCSMLYHLAKLGWTDVVLLEKTQLTAGSTWHAAGMVPTFSKSVLITSLVKNSLALYRTFAKDTENPIELHQCGNIWLSRTDDEMVQNRRYLGIAEAVDIPAELIGPGEIAEKFPLLDTSGMKGGLWLPQDSYVDPSQTTQAFARSARKAGARIFQRAQVERILQRADGTWEVETSRGRIEAEFLVNCGGMWASEISALVGGTLPSVAIEHAYLVTESVPEIEALDFELPMLHDMSVPMYTRPDKKGLYVSCYEDYPRFFGVDGIPGEFGQELLQPDLERTESRLEKIMRMIPCLNSVGIRTVVNGPTPRSPDRMPLVGPAHGLKNYFVLCGIYGGFSLSSLAQHVAEWIVYGEPGVNLDAFDVRRFGSYANKTYAVKRLSTGHAFQAPVYYPHEEHAEARPIWTSSIFHLLKSKGAVFGSREGWEVANWFAPQGMGGVDELTFKRPNWFEPVRREYEAVRSGIGVLDYSCLAKFEVGGPDAATYLDSLSANALPGAGSLRVAPVVNGAGHVIAHWLVGRLANDRFYVTATPGRVEKDLDLLRWNAPAGVKIENVSRQTAVLAVAGPGVPSLLKAIGADKHLNCLESAFCIEDKRIDWLPVRIVRLNWGRIPVWELHTPMECLVALYEALFSAGGEFGVADFGMRAAESMRLEAGLPVFGVDIPPMCDPWQSNLGSFVSRDKWRSMFGVDGVRGARNGGRRLVHLEISSQATADAVVPWHDEPVLAGGRCVGVLTSASFGFARDRALAFAVVDADCLGDGLDLAVEVMGRKYPARTVENNALRP